MLKQIATLLLITQMTLQACEVGCLRCNDQNQCLICDASQFYTYDSANKSCKKVTSDNCLFIDLVGACLACRPGFYLNTSKACTAVPTENLTANPQCEFWDSATSCRECSTHHLIVGSTCEAVTTQVSNCSDYSSKTVCSECESKYTLVENACTALPTTANCMTYSDFQCQSCKLGFILNTNLYLKQYGNLETDLQRQMALGWLMQVVEGEVDLRNQSVCESVTVENCLVLTDFKTCDTCNASYYLTADYLCKANPPPVILNCKDYTSNTVCVDCQEGFYLQNSSTCTVVDSVDKCAKHATSTTSSQCVECQSGYYLQTTSKCQERTNVTIDNCQQLNIDKDSCFLCSNSFVGSGSASNYTACLQSLDNCGIHSISGGVVTCTGCVDGFHLNNQAIACVAGSLDNCKIYDQSQSTDTCMVCNNSFRLVGNKCLAHETIQNCDVYDNERVNFCNTCQKGFFSVRLQNHCQGDVFSTINNCMTYNGDVTTQSECSVCNSGFYLSSNTVCSSITIDNCSVAANNDQCDTCNANYAKVLLGSTTKHTCAEPLLSVSSNCNTFDVTSTGMANAEECVVCKSNTYGYSTANHNICVHNDRVDSLKNNFDLITGCSVYSDLDSVTCLRCTDNKYLDPTNETSSTLACKDSCTETILAVSVKSGDATNYSSANNIDVRDYASQIRRNQCISGENFKVMAYDRETQTVFGLSCKTGFIPVVGGGTMWSMVNPNATNQNWVTNLGGSWPQLESCIDYTGVEINNTPNANSLPANCQYFHSSGGDTIFNCVKCVHTRAGRPLKRADNVNYLTCDTVQNCDDTVYGNMPLGWLKYLGCHKCKGATEVPVLAGFFTLGILQGHQRWTNVDTADELLIPDNTEGNGLPVELCVTNTTDDLNTALGTGGDFVAVSNCGMYYFELAGDNRTIVTNLVLVCGFCAPNHKIGTANNDGFPTSCVKINTCKVNPTQPWVNACSECEVTYTWEYNANDGKVDYTSCVSSGQNNANCYAYDEANSHCALCKKGFNLNEDNLCEVAQASHCQSGRYSNAYWPAPVLDKRFVEFVVTYQVGCEQCETGFSAILNHPVRYEMAQNSCLSTDYVNDSKTYSYPAVNQSQYIQNCLMYHATLEGTGDTNVVSDKHRRCEVCATGYILTHDQRECLLQTENANCLTAMSRNNSGCYMCALTHGRTKPNASYICVDNTIENCKYPDNTSDNLSQLECKTCNDGFYYDTTQRKCLRGNVDNCLTHLNNQANSCDTCLSGFMKVASQLLSNNDQELLVVVTNVARDYCIAIPSELGCASGSLTRYSSEKTGYALFTCSACTESFRVPLLNIVPTTNAHRIDNMCFPHNVVANCEDYLVGEHLENSNFSCTKCSVQYYRDRLGYSCVDRVYQPTNCSLYQLSEDRCETCENSTFISTDGKLCTSYPDGLLGCDSYNTVEGTRICVQCDGSSYFLQDNNCVKVVLKDNNCAEVSGEGTCNKCKTGFYLNASALVDLLNHCQSATGVTNCASLASTTSCEVCNLGYRRETNSQGNNTCVDIADANCSLFNENGQCSRCKQNFYPDTSTTHHTCKTVGANVITSCLQNATLETCLLCSADTALSADSRSCKDKLTFDSNCEVQVMPSERVCSLCESGYYFVDGVCTSWTGNSSPSAGCFVPEQVDRSVCMLCKTGYHMRSDYTCVVNSSGGGGSTSSFAGIIESFIYAVILMAF